jgi:hypothetical protein
LKVNPITILVVTNPEYLAAGCAVGITGVTEEEVFGIDHSKTQTSMNTPAPPATHAIGADVYLSRHTASLHPGNGRVVAEQHGVCASDLGAIPVMGVT